jgi:hypothetical protein
MGSNWGGIVVNAGGSADLAYTNIEQTTVPFSCGAGATKCKADHTALLHYTGVGMQLAESGTYTYMDVEFGGSDGIYFNGTSTQTVSITDSVFHVTGGDAIVAGGSGNLTFQFNHVYGDGGANPGQHCACHFDSNGTMLIDHNIFEKSTYGLMASQMNAQSKVNYNNFSNDSLQYGPASGGINASADLTHNYWGSATPPTITGNTTDKGTDGVNYYSTAIATGVGPR